jgi:DNA repair protein RecO (recombination protein O)
MKKKSLAIPIRCIDFSNSSQIVSLFTREDGLLEGIAKGAHRDKSPFQGPFDLAVLYEVVFLERRSAGLALLTEAAVLDGYRGLRANWGRHVAASHCLEFLRAVAMAGDPTVLLFDLAKATLGDLSRAKPGWVGAILARFDTRALKVLGLLAPMEVCIECGREWPPSSRPVFLSPERGGILCTACRTLQPGLRGAPLPGRALQILHRLMGDDGSERLWKDLERDWRVLGPPVARAVRELRTNLLERELALLKYCPSWT